MSAYEVVTLFLALPGAVWATLELLKRLK
ncbi:hypothetical protein FGG51_gp007 [Mycobacterium phage Astro]|uniref:Uncharacterized protein n=3 Tax=Fromanvirus astro TaxID=1195075 RepID=I6S7E8_9CAUD|nr:hypothetical protein V424_gp015 [Mycobacterium phage Fredward]YP_009204190.1 hypothetical protein AVT31_gp007 [Mycobacterium phage Smeadley]YP_009638557.1 hypothetical protein FGG51_gp007 [Mycobacterium phage Astro]AXQ63605.1 hypothetical protein SEA_DIXON_99 [Mycobacterium phage Dixon]AYD87030.1 hypothetical protein SEA_NEARLYHEADLESS_101 [Mycobacterium phage NearlyHeadless]QDH93058.1 hypothetical protein SEA_STEPHIG9_101 [Mycobacterium phage Stephig9]QXN73068.1 hypothetical protein SEA_P